MDNLEKAINTLTVEHAHRELFDKYYVQTPVLELTEEEIDKYKRVISDCDYDWRAHIHEMSKLLKRKAKRYTDKINFK